MSNVIDYHTSVNHAADRRGFSLGNPLGIVQAILKRYKDRRELTYLLSLSDYQLRDIGLQRGDIQREAYKPLWRL